MNVLKLLASDGFLSVNKHIARAVGLDAAVLLAELASSCNYYESADMLTEDGMFYETVEKIEENTTLTKYQQAKAIKVLEGCGVLRTARIGIPAKRYFKVNGEMVLALVDNKKLKNFTTGSEEILPQEVKKPHSNNNREKERKDNNRVNRFIPPTLDDIKEYCRERNNSVDPEKFYNYYESNGWKVGRNGMKDWRAAVRTWERNDRSRTSRQREDEMNSYYDMARDWAVNGV